jgi:hypothetical protein
MAAPPTAHNTDHVDPVPPVQGASSTNVPSAERSDLTAGEVLFWAPIGLAAKAAVSLPGAVEERVTAYRRQATVARVLGKMIVDQQRRKRAIAAAQSKAQQSAATDRSTDRSAEVPAPVAAQTTVVEPIPVEQPAPASEDLGSEGIDEGFDLPIDGYDTLPARTLLGLLAGLSSDELRHVERYERAHRNRATVLGAVAQRLSESVS